MESTPLAARVVRCPRCRKELVFDALSAAGVREACPSCRADLFVHRFAALGLPKGVDRADIAEVGEAACFFHPEKKAAIACQQCGRFICALCDLPIGSRHLCPSCVESGLSSEKVPEMVNRRVIWGGLALGLGWLPILIGAAFFPIFIVSGPMAIFAGIYSFKKPGSVVRGRRRVAASFGILGGLIQVVGLAAFAYFAFNGFSFP